VAVNTLERPLPFKSVVTLVGGVGGAKFADGLARCLPPGSLTAIVNTGDDFTRYGLTISPDLDTVMYTLGGLAHPVNGWGLEGDTAQMLGMLKRYGDDAWFGLFDRDVATHLLRTQWLTQGISLTEVTRRLSDALAIPSPILPMADRVAPTLIDTLEYGVLPFQEYFVRYHWQPTVTRVILPDGIPATRAALDALARADLIIIGPSNPLLSVEPILNCIGVRETIAARRAAGVRCIALSPIVAGQAIKGPAAKLMQELDLPVSASGVADRYEAVIDGFIVQTGDWPYPVAEIGAVSAGGAVGTSGTLSRTLSILETEIVMHSLTDRARLAEEVLTWATRLVD